VRYPFCIFQTKIAQYYGQTLENGSFYATFNQNYVGKSYVLILTENGLGNIMGDFFTKSSGLPGFDWVVTTADGATKIRLPIDILSTVDLTVYHGSQLFQRLVFC
jgi:allantoicase